MPTAKRKAPAGRRKAPAGRLALDLRNVPLPRGRGWRYAVNLCGNELFSAKSYADLMRPHAVSDEVDFSPGDHALRIRGSRAGVGVWEVEVKAAAPRGQGFTDIRTVALKDSVGSVGRVRSAKYRVTRATGVVEWLQQGARGLRVTPVRRGMTVPSGSVLVTGPRASAVLEPLSPGGSKAETIGALRVTRLGSTPTVAAGAHAPTITFNRGRPMAGRADCGHCVACSVRG